MGCSYSFHSYVDTVVLEQELIEGTPLMQPHLSNMFVEMSNGDIVMRKTMKVLVRECRHCGDKQTLFMKRKLRASNQYWGCQYKPQVYGKYSIVNNVIVKNF